VHGPQPRSYDYQFPRKKLLGALRSALAAKLADGKLTVVENFELKEAKSKAFRVLLDGLNVEKSALLVQGTKDQNKNLELSSRNLAGVELIAGNAVHPYHLLRYDRAIFSLAALEKLQDSLKATAPRGRKEVA
jgi:large subunit ribosomal protein L4